MEHHKFNYSEKQISPKLLELMAVTASLLLLAFLGVLDKKIHPGIPFSVLFYLVPVCLMAWFSGLWQGIAFAVAAVVIRFFAEVEPENIFIFLWENGVRLTFMLLISVLLSNLKREIQHEKESARTDYLTGLANRRHFFETAANEIERIERYKRPFTMAYIDVDDFKKINDSHGHDTGDRVLKMIAGLIAKNIRKPDFVARLGGDEFALIMPETDTGAARKAMSKIHGILATAAQALSFKVTMSIGAVTFLSAPFSVDEMIKTADNLMYEAKKSGKNSIRHREIK